MSKSVFPLYIRVLSEPPCRGTTKRLKGGVVVARVTVQKAKWRKKRMHFFLNMNPPTKTYQEHRIGKRKDGSVYTYEDRELKEIRVMYRNKLVKFVPDQPISGPVRLVVKWCFSRGRHKDGEYKITKPDTDNLDKMLKDVMTEVGFWNDDAQVASEIIEKFWADIPGIYIEIYEL